MSENYIPIANHFNVQSGFAFPSASFVEDGIPIVRMSDLKNERLKFENTKYVSPRWLKISASFTLKEYDFLIGMSGSLSNYAVVSVGDIPALLNQRVGRLQSKSGKQSYEYVCYWLKSAFYQRYAEIQGEGAAQKNISPRQIELFKYRAISLNEQRRVVEILQTIDQTIEKAESLIEKYQQIKAGLMHDLFTRGIGANGKLRPHREQAPELYQKTPIGWIPKEWTPLPLNEILKEFGGYLQTGPFGSQLHAHEYTHEGIPVVMPQDINDGKIGEEQIARIPECRAQSLLKHRLKLGDIIIARRGELSRAADITCHEQGWVCGTGCFLLRLGSSNLDARFFSHMYRHPTIQRQVEGLAVGSTMPSLNNEIMGKLVFPRLGAEEQSGIANRVELVDVRIESMKSELAKLKMEKTGLMHDLLTGKVEVKIDQPEVSSF